MKAKNSNYNNPFDEIIAENQAKKSMEEVKKKKHIQEVLNKYEKIEKIVKNRGGKPSLAILDSIVRVVEDGNNN